MKVRHNRRVVYVHATAVSLWSAHLYEQKTVILHLVNEAVRFPVGMQMMNITFTNSIARSLIE